MDDIKQTQIDIEVIKEKITHLFDQFKRHSSHLESEQRVTGSISKRVDQIERVVTHIEEKLDREEAEHKRDQERQEDNELKKSRWKVETIVNIVCTVATVGTLIVMIINQNSQ